MTLAIQTLVAASLLGATPQLPPAPRARDASSAQMVRAGAGSMVAGGVIMAVGAGILMPYSLVVIARSTPPDPAEYAAVPPFERDLYAYRIRVYRALRVGVGGAITASVGALAFVTGVAMWGAGRRRQRRASLSVLPARGGGRAQIVMHF